MGWQVLSGSHLKPSGAAPNLTHCVGGLLPAEQALGPRARGWD